MFSCCYTIRESSGNDFTELVYVEIFKPIQIPKQKATLTDWERNTESSSKACYRRTHKVAKLIPACQRPTTVTCDLAPFPRPTSGGWRQPSNDLTLASASPSVQLQFQVPYAVLRTAAAVLDAAEIAGDPSFSVFQSPRLSVPVSDHSDHLT